MVNVALTHACFALCYCGAVTQARALGDGTYTFLDALLEVGEYTALVEVIFGHEDHFGAFDGHLIENKLTLHRGAADASTALSALPAIGPVPLGALAIPRYKICTIIGAMQDVELHELHGVFHAGRTPALLMPAPHAEAAQTQSKRAKKRKVQSESRTCMLKRACWRRTPDGKCGVMYPDGVGVADWLSKYY